MTHLSPTNDLAEKIYIVQSLKKVTTPKRLELKKAYNIRELPIIEGKLLRSNLNFRRAYHSRQVNSLYFDNSKFSAIEDSLSGTSERKKTRLRWYGKLRESNHPTLEVKFKKGQTSWKKLYSTSLRLDPFEDTWADAFTSKSSEPCNYNIRDILLDGYTWPVSLVSYNRKYFESFDGRIRVTIDQKLTYRDQTLFSKPNFEKKRTVPQIIILEFKLARENQNLLRSIAHSLDFTPERFSKYCESSYHHRVKWR